MKEKRIHSILAIVAIWMFAAGMEAYAQTPAGTTADRATRINDTITLTVQSGSNYIRIEPNRLPATITYLPDTAFGPLPMALVTGDTLDATVIFQYASCQMGWQWTLERDEVAKIMEVKAHENASMLVEPLVCPDNTDTVAEVWDSIVWYGTTYKTSGEYPIEYSNVHGCEWTHTLLLTVHTTSYDSYSESKCDSIIYRGKRYTVSGEYKDTVLAEDGNRTITTLSFTIAKSSLAEVNVVVYEPYLSPSGKTYTEDGDYIDTIANIAGCDSIITTHLTMKGTTRVTLDPMSGCDRIEWEGKTYTQSGTYSDTTYAVDGHRTITSVTMTIGHTTYGEENIYKTGSYTSSRGNVYTESGDYTETITNVAGCDSIITLHITIGDATYDTVYFCRGYNREHEEQVNEILIRRYLPYTYEAPLMADYQEGVVIEKNDRQALVNFHRAESNLRNHYTNGLTPIESITWSIRYSGQSGYTPIVVAEAQPQWIDMGTIAVQIMFRCGEVYNNAFPMGVEETEVSGQVVKRIMNGQVVIIRGGAVYTLMGQRIGNL